VNTVQVSCPPAAYSVLYAFGAQAQGDPGGAGQAGERAADQVGGHWAAAGRGVIAAPAAAGREQGQQRSRG